MARHPGFTCDRAELESLAQAALARAKRAGASGCDCDVSEAHGLTVTVRKGKPDTIEHNRDRFLGAVQKTRAGGNTPLTESITQGVDRLVQQRDHQLGYGEFRLIVVTDGQATGRPLPQAVDYARQQRIPIYTIGLCIGEKHELRRYSVSYRAADSIEALKRGLEETLAETNVFDPQTFSGR